MDDGCKMESVACSIEIASKLLVLGRDEVTKKSDLCFYNWFHKTKRNRAVRKFINVFVGYPGSSHDATVWVNSPVHKQLMQNHYEVIPLNRFSIFIIRIP
ncbi:hypothetical protein ACI65C_006651 [Semiaphis heraclei]